MTAQTTEARQNLAHAPRRGTLRTVLWLLTLALVGSTVWLTLTESGLRAVCRALEAGSAGRFSLQEPIGKLLGPLSFQSVRWRTGTLDVDAQGLQLEWRPAQILRGKLSIARLDIASLRLASTSSEGATPLPASLRLPLTVEVERFAVGRLEQTEFSAAADQVQSAGRPVTWAERLEAQLSSDGERHQLRGFHATFGRFDLRGEATLDGDSPFVLASRFRLSGESSGRAIDVGLSARGSLEDLTVSGTTRRLPGDSGEGFAGTLRARLSPFAAQPVLEAVAQLSDLDPSGWIAGAPRADLTAQIELRPLPGPAGEAGALGGLLSVVNRKPARVDQGGLPAESLSAGLTLRDALQIADLDLRLSGGGRLAGEGVLKGATLLLDLAAQSLNAAALHGGLVRTKLAGAVRTRLALNEQALDVDLHDPRFVVHTRLALGKSGLRVDSLRLAAQEAQLEFSGRLALAGAGDFSGRGSLKNFDPSRFGQAGFFPAARLNGEFAAEGSLHPALALGLRFQLSDSRGAAKTPGLSGNGVVDLAGRHLRRVDLALEVAGNRFSAKGALGAPDEKLELLLAAPALDRIGVPGLSGDVEGRVVAGGSLDNPHLAGEVHAERLAAAGLGELRGLALEGRLDSGAQGELAGKLRLASLASPSRKPLLNAVRIDAEGVRNQHRLSAEGRLDGRRKLHLRLDGGFAGLELNAWHGVLSEFLIASARGRETPFLRLAAAVPLHLSAPLLSLGPADLQGVGWSAHLARLSRQEKDGQRAGWQGAGWVRGLPVQDLLAEFSESSELAAPPASDQAKSRQAIAALRVSGDWELSLGESLSGSTRWARDSGDLRVGNVDLGLDQAELSVGIRAGHLQGNLKVHGKTLGSLAGEIDGQLASGTGQGGLFDGRAPLRGQLRVRVPDLSWAGGLAGEAFQFAGGLTGAVTVSGSADQAVLSGEWRGEDLALRQLDQGLRLERGTLLADLAGGVATGDMRLRLRQLSFASDFQPLPRVLALDGGIDGAALTSLPGRLEGSGELWLGRSDASLKLRFDRVGLVQRPDQWLMVSGSGELTLGERVLDATGRWRIDAGYWALAGSGKPQLSDDVVTKNEGARRDSAAASRWLALNLDIDLGNSFHFFGAGLESRLAGALKIKSSGGSLPRASGSIQSVGGRFDAYGQKLEIERGIVNFQGLIDNPGLNVRAMRKNQAVEAGVEVTGTVQRPTIRLVSDPQVPDAEKLSWLILGQATDQPSAQDTSRLLAAAGSLFGGQEGGTLRRLQQRLGVDEFAINSGSLDGSGRRIGSRVVSTTGFGASETVSGQIVSVGKRLSSNALLSYEQSLTTTGSIVKLSVDINRDFSVVGRAGSDNALDFFWNYRFGR